MPAIFEPVVLIAKDGQSAIEVQEFEGVNKIENRDAVGFYFTIRANPNQDYSRVSVLFSGMSFYASPEHFGLPDFKDRDVNFLQFALAAIGDHLDENSLLPVTPSGVPAAKIECFTPQFQVWKDREPSSDTEIQSYMESRLYWSWCYGHTGALFTSHDLLRLGARMTARMGQIEEGNG
jgi:hypothetical protein